MFLNFSNHPSGSWDAKQVEAARRWGEIRDIPFPNVGAELDEAAVDEIAKSSLDQILVLRPDVVLCQGEMTLTYRVVRGLLRAGIPVVAACSERVVREVKLAGGGDEKTSIFRFCRFRSYGAPSDAGDE